MDAERERGNFINHFQEMMICGMVIVRDEKSYFTGNESTRLYDETEFEKYRVIQDRLFIPDFDKYMLELEENTKK